MLLVGITKIVRVVHGIGWPLGRSLGLPDILTNIRWVLARGYQEL